MFIMLTVTLKMHQRTPTCIDFSVQFQKKKFRGRCPKITPYWKQLRKRKRYWKQKITNAASL